MVLKNYITGGFVTAFLAAAVLCQAQSKVGPAISHVTFFNAMTNSSPLTIKWSGVNLFPDGLAAGRSAGPLAIPAGGASIEAALEGCLAANASISLTQDTKTSFILYLGAPEIEKESGETKLRVKVFQTAAIPISTPAKLEWPIIYLGSAETVQLEVNGVPVTLARGKTTTVGHGKKYVRLSQGERELAAISVEEEADRIFLVYGPPENLSAGVLYR
jgi:hypothetical protein